MELKINDGEEYKMVRFLVSIVMNIKLAVFWDGAAGSSETWVPICWATWRQIPEDSNLNMKWYQMLKIQS
jgi:hypothetical protein